MPGTTEASRWVARYAATGLLLVAGLEWLLGRTVSRMAASPVLEGTPRDIVVTLGQTGLFLVSPTFLLAACLMIVGIWSLAQRAVRSGNRELTALVFFLAISTAVVLGYTVLSIVSPADWLTTAFNILLLLALLWICVRYVVRGRAPLAARVGVLFAGLAYTGWYVYVLAQQVGNGGFSGEGISFWAITLGELFLVLSPVAYFVAVAVPGGEWRHLRRWILPVVLSLAFAGGNIADAIANQGFTGVFTTWSLGINIAWPWPLYAVSLALYTYSVLTCFANKTNSAYASPDLGAGLLLLLTAGYNLQTSYQHLLALLALMILTGLITPFGEGVAHAQGSYREADAMAARVIEPRAAK